MAKHGRRQRVHDHRLRELVRETGDARIATDCGVPRSTATGWLRMEPVEAVTQRLEAERAAARHARREAKRNVTCAACIAGKAAA